MHWVDRSAAQVNIGEELARRGWRLWGYDPGGWDGDPGQDYPDLPRFEGVATKGDAVACVAVDSYKVQHRSGTTPVRYERAETGLCPHCEGSGAEPGGWTLEQARANPVEYNRRRAPVGTVPVFPEVVSPLAFGDDGREKCRSCGGTGRTYERREVRLETWPTFQANPPRRTWHVERDGKVLASGVGLEKCARDSEEGRQAVRALVDKIEAALARPERPAPVRPNEPAGPGADGARFLRDREWTWLEFDRKPAPEILATLKASGWRWSPRRRAWYHMGGAAAPLEVRPLLAEQAGA